jgi:hypothetical protein
MLDPYLVISLVFTPSTSGLAAAAKKRISFIVYFLRSWHLLRLSALTQAATDANRA